MQFLAGFAQHWQLFLPVGVIGRGGRGWGWGGGCGGGRQGLGGWRVWDTGWGRGLRAPGQMRSVDRGVGGVGTRQNVFEPGSSIWRRVADWIIDLRYLDYV